VAAVDSTDGNVADRPLIVLDLPGTLGAWLCAGLGRHPQLYGLPELQLFGAESVGEWWGRCASESFPMAHGLLRTVAQLFFGGQSDEAVREAQGWLNRRSHVSTGMILETIAERVAPSTVVERSPGTVYRSESLNRAGAMFPGARFLHLVQHPVGHSRWVMDAIEASSRSAPAPYWLLHLASFSDLGDRDGWAKHDLEKQDPVIGWYVLHMNVSEFLESVPEHQQHRVAIEDLLLDGDKALLPLLEWLGLRTDAAALERMRRPDRSEYAGYGPQCARYGNDAFFLENPRAPDCLTEHRRLAELHRRGRRTLVLPDAVRGLARRLGYR
jgi:hypothetical protein